MFIEIKKKKVNFNMFVFHSRTFRIENIIIIRTYIIKFIIWPNLYLLLYILLFFWFLNLY